MKNIKHIFTESCVAVRMDTNEVLFSGSAFFCDAMRTGNGGVPAVDPSKVEVMTKKDFQKRS